jgi:hypothetical protein
MDPFALLPVAFLLAVANKAIIGYLAEPIRKKFPDLDMWWLTYVSFATGVLIGYLADVNLFASTGLVGIPGRVLSACVIGGGASLLHDVFDHPDVRTTTTATAELSASGVLTTDTTSVAKSEPTA